MKFSTPDLDQLAIDWPMVHALALPKNPVIVVAGAYQGKVMRLLAELYPEHKALVGFEPQMWAVKRAEQAVEHLPCAHVFRFGLLAGKGTAILPMGEFETDAASVYSSARITGDGVFYDAATVLRKWLPIDLFVMNMEGYEYELLPYLKHKGILKRVASIAVQYHTQYSTPEKDAAVADVRSMYRVVYADFPRWEYLVKP